MLITFRWNRNWNSGEINNIVMTTVCYCFAYCFCNMPHDSFSLEWIIWNFACGIAIIFLFSSDWGRNIQKRSSSLINPSNKAENIFFIPLMCFFWTRAGKEKKLLLEVIFCVHNEKNWKKAHFPSQHNIFIKKMRRKKNYQSLLVFLEKKLSGKKSSACAKRRRQIFVGFSFSKKVSTVKKNKTSKYCWREMLYWMGHFHGFPEGFMGFKSKENKNNYELWIFRQEILTLGQICATIGMKRIPTHLTIKCR